MRLNVYSQELILDDDNSSIRSIQVVEQVAETGVIYSGVRIYLHSSERLHHREDDDDRSAITFWLPKSKDKRRRLGRLFASMAILVNHARLETGLDE